PGVHRRPVVQPEEPPGDAPVPVPGVGGVADGLGVLEAEPFRDLPGSEDAGIAARARDGLVACWGHGCRLPGECRRDLNRLTSSRSRSRLLVTSCPGKFVAAFFDPVTP